MRYLFALLALLLTPALAHAGIKEVVTGWLSGEVLAIIITAILAVVAGAFGTVYLVAVKFSRELGELLIATADALEDKRVSREEVSDWMKELVDVFGVVNLILALFGKKVPVPSPLADVSSTDTMPNNPANPGQ